MLGLFKTLGIALGTILGISAAFGDVPNTFENGQIADADQINQNFKALDDAVTDLDARISNLNGTQGALTCSYETLSGTWFVPLQLDYPFSAGYIILSLETNGRISSTVYPENAVSFSASGSYSLQADCLIPRLSVSGGGISLELRAAASLNSATMVGNGYASDGSQLLFNAVKIK